MSRVQRYQQSFERFITDRNCFSDVSEKHKDIIDKSLSDKDYILPILTLTVMTSRKKKNNLSYQVYYTAMATEFLRIMFENKQKTKVEDINETMMLLALKYWNFNIISIKKKISVDKLLKIQTQFMDVITSSMQPVFNSVDIEYDDVKLTDLHRSFLKKTDVKLLDRFKSIKKIKKECLDTYIINGICKMVEVAIVLGWIIGCGSESGISKLKKVAEHFGFMLKIANDFLNIERDIMNSKDNTTFNYVLNNGVQESFEMFNDSKDAFIESAMTLEIMSPTIGEIVNMLDARVVNVIDSTSPDLKSNYSVI